MDINDLRIIFTLLVFIAFIGIVAWAYSAKRKRSFDQAANLVFDEEDAADREAGAGKKHN
jgi:cytochrome c oxidase cbb3-type subunit 4